MLGFNLILFIAEMGETEAYSEAVVAASRNLAVRRRDRSTARKADSVTRPERTAQCVGYMTLRKKLSQCSRDAQI